MVSIQCLQYVRENSLLFLLFIPPPHTHTYSFPLSPSVEIITYYNIINNLSSPHCSVLSLLETISIQNPHSHQLIEHTVSQLYEF